MASLNANPLRSISTFTPAGRVFGPSATDRLIGDLRTALDRRDGYCTAYADARAWLSRANRSRTEYRRANQRDAMRAINLARAAIRARAKAVVVARAALVAAGMTPEQIAVLAPGGEA